MNSKEAFEKWYAQSNMFGMNTSEREFLIWQSAIEYQKEVDAKICDGVATGCNPQCEELFRDSIRNQKD